jgi:hypothetical protein
MKWTYERVPLRRRYQGGAAIGDDAPETPAGPDYDYAAAEKAGVQPDERGHMPDTFKLPNHITFSDESMYHGDENEGGPLVPTSGR